MLFYHHKILYHATQLTTDAEVDGFKMLGHFLWYKIFFLCDCFWLCCWRKCLGFDRATQQVTFCVLDISFRAWVAAGTPLPEEAK